MEDIEQTLKCSYKHIISLFDVLNVLSPHLKSLLCEYSAKLETIYLTSNNKIPPKRQIPSFDEQTRIVAQFKQNVSKNEVNYSHLYKLFCQLVGEHLSQYIKINCSVFAREPTSNFLIHINGKTFFANWTSAKIRQFEAIYSNWVNIDYSALSDIFKRILQNDTDAVKSSVFEECQRDEAFRLMFVSRPHNINRQDLFHSSVASGLCKSPYSFPMTNEVDAFVAIAKKQIFKWNTGTVTQLDKSLAQIYHNFRKCNFVHLLNHCCPNRFAGCSADMIDLEQTLSLSTSRKEFFKFLFSVYRFIFPNDVFGSKHNYYLFYKNLKILFVANYVTKFRFWDAINGLDLDVMRPMFADVYSSALSNGKIEIHFLCWAFELIKNIVKCKFYVTESAFRKYELLFYRFDIWARIRSHAIRKLTKQGKWQVSQCKEPIANECLNSSQYLKYSRFRMIPKRRGVRPITSLKYSRQSKSFKSNVNVLHSLLKKLKRLSAIDTRDRLTNSWDIHKKVLEIKEINSQNDRVSCGERGCGGGGGGMFYLIRGDFQNCYQSILLGKLEYIITMQIHQFTKHWKCEKVKFTGVPLPVALTFQQIELTRKGKFNYTKRVEYVIIPVNYHQTSYDDGNGVDDVDMTSLMKNQLGDDCIDRCIIKSTTKLIIPTKDIIQVLRVYLYDNYILLGRKSNCKFICGIRQGGPLSSLMCDIYLNYLWTHYCSQFFITPAENAFFKFADDFLFATKNFKTAKNFLETITNGFPAMNLTVNKNKVMINFNSSTGTIDKFQSVNYLGRKIYCDLSFGIDISSFEEMNIVDTFNCNLFQPVIHVMKSLIGKLIMSSKTVC